LLNSFVLVLHYRVNFKEDTLFFVRLGYKEKFIRNNVLSNPLDQRMCSVLGKQQLL